MTMRTLIKTVATCAALVTAAGSANAASSPSGVWIDHTGRGGVEIRDCGGALCGRVVWVKDATNAKGCGMQVIGAVKPVSANSWDHGWIYDPDDNRKYNVELVSIDDNTLKVEGYMGTKMLSETMIWHRAPANIQRCQ